MRVEQGSWFRTEREGLPPGLLSQWGVGWGQGAGSMGVVYTQAPMGPCRHHHWDQCLIYVENADICTFLKPDHDPVLPRLSTPRDRAGLWAGGPSFGLSKLDPRPYHWHPRLSWFTKGTQTNLFIELAVPMWLCLTCPPSLQLPSPWPALQEWGGAAHL